MSEHLPLSLEIFVLFAIAALLAFAAAHDIAARTIPNAIPLCIALIGASLRLQQHQFAAELGIAIILFFIFTLLWLRGLMGGGDVKLIAAAALLVPPSQALVLLVWVALSGGVVSLLYLLLQRVVSPPAQTRPRRLFARLRRAEQWRIARHGSLPYACAIAAGTCFTLLGH